MKRLPWQGEDMMRTTRSERVRAARISAVVDELISDPKAQLAEYSEADTGVLETARQLARLPSLLGPVNPALEQRVLRAARAERGLRRGSPVVLPVRRHGGFVAPLATGPFRLISLHKGHAQCRSLRVRRNPALCPRWTAVR